MNKINATSTRTGERINITWGSLITYLAFTAIGTVIGEYVYQAYVLPKIPQLESDTTDLLNKF